MSLKLELNQKNDEENNMIQNILNWYPFKKEEKILQIGRDEKLRELFEERVNEVVTMEYSKLNSIEIKDNYDIITLIGIDSKFKLEEILKKLTNNLKADGRFLIAVDNKFGLRFFAGNPENILNKKFESLIGYNNEPGKIETYTRKSLEKKLKELGYNIRFYYPLPDYRMANVIFTDEQLPEYNTVDKYNPYYVEKSDILFNEIDVFREILKTDKEMFTFFANSFLIEASKQECDKTYKYISFNNLRKEEYMLITKIANEYVEKQIVNKKAKKHYQNIKDNIQILNDNNIKTVDYIEEEKIRSRYIEQRYLLNNVLTELLEQQKLDEFYNIIDKYLENISVNTYRETNYEKTVFGKNKIEIDNYKIIENMHFVKNGLWDMTFKNCFYIDNEFYFFDQEWNEPNLPVEFILYRSIFYTISLRRFIPIEKIFEKYNLIPYLKLFEKLDNKIQENIRDNTVWEFYSQNRKFNIDETKQELINQNIRQSAQLAENENLKKQNAELQEQINLQQKEINELEFEIGNTFTNRVKRKIKKMCKAKK